MFFLLFFKENLSALSLFLSISEMGLRAVSRSQSSFTSTGHQCWSAVLGWLQCALMDVEVASRALTCSIRCSAGWGCSRRKTSWMSSGSWSAICAPNTVKIHQCQHTAAQTCLTADLQPFKTIAIKTQGYDWRWRDCLTLCLCVSIMMQEPYIDKTRIGAFGQVNKILHFSQ